MSSVTFFGASFCTSFLPLFFPRVYTAESAVDGDGDRSGGRWTRGGNVLKGKDGTTIGDRRKALRDRAFQKEQEVGRLTKELQVDL